NIPTKTVKAYLYCIKSTFAMRQKRPASFFAIKLQETDRAVRLYGKAKNQLVDSWFPKRAITKCLPTTQEIAPPENVLIREKGKQEKNAIIYHDRIEIRFPYNPNTVNFVKILPGRKFNLSDEK